MPVMAATIIPIYIDGKKVDCDVPPVLVNNRTMVPIRFISEELDANVDWQYPNIFVSKDGLKLQLTLKSKTAYKNGAAMASLDAAPFLKTNRTMVPMRFIAEALNVQVDYIGGKVLIYSGSFKKIAQEKAYYYNLALEKRFDHLPEISQGKSPDNSSLLMYAYFNKNNYREYDEMSKEYVEKVAKDNFAMENINHSSTKEWKLNGDIYTATGWSYTSACFYELVEVNSYTENSKTIYEVILDEFSFLEYQFLPIDFTPNFEETYSAPMMYVMEKKGTEIKNGMSTIDAIKALFVKGDTDNFERRESLRVKYYIDEANGNMVFTHVERFNFTM